MPSRNSWIDSAILTCQRYLSRNGYLTYASSMDSMAVASCEKNMILYKASEFRVLSISKAIMETRKDASVPISMLLTKENLRD